MIKEMQKDDAFKWEERHKARAEGYIYLVSAYYTSDPVRATTFLYQYEDDWYLLRQKLRFGGAFKWFRYKLSEDDMLWDYILD